MNTHYDPRRTAARSDLAAETLRGSVVAESFVKGVRKQVIVSHSPLKRTPSFETGLETEALRGEYVTIYDEGEEGWSWGQLERDNYVGWFPSHDLGKAGLAPTHRLKVQRSFTYPAPNMKLPILGILSMGSQLHIMEIKGDFARTDRNEFVWAAHLSAIDGYETDFVAVAEQFLHVPYLWGGKTSMGLDCSGLVQVALQVAGIEAPRDSDMLAAETGNSIDIVPDFCNLRRGDLIFWRGHVGIMQDATTLLHANGYHMMVASENLIEAIQRIRLNSFGDVTGIRRIERP